MARNYYMILGVEIDASQEEIKHAYRQKALELHPDHCGENAEPFLEAQEAYGVLSDPARRQAYDRSLRGSPRVTVRRGPVTEVRQRRRPPIEPIDHAQHAPHAEHLEDVSLSRSFQTFFPSFEEIFDHLWSNFTGRPPPKAEKLENLTIDVPLSSRDALAGGSVRVLVPAAIRCPACRGSGALGPFECMHCAGAGSVADEVPLPISFPPGIPDNYTVTVPLDRLGIHNMYLTVRFRYA